MKYAQRVVLVKNTGTCSSDTQTPSLVEVDFASCIPCPAGSKGGFCQHVFTLLIVLENCSSDLPGPDSVISNQKSWGPRERDIQPSRIMDTVVEIAKEEKVSGRKHQSLAHCMRQGLKKLKF